VVDAELGAAGAGRRASSSKLINVVAICDLAPAETPVERELAAGDRRRSRPSTRSVGPRHRRRAPVPRSSTVDATAVTIMLAGTTRRLRSTSSVDSKSFDAVELHRTGRVALRRDLRPATT
jgi:acetolactate synthase small subunit